MLNKQGFYDLLDRNNIVYESIEHPAVYTMEEIYSYQIPHTEHIVKNLFLMGVLNNIQKNVTVVFDKDLVGQKIGIHPMENTATVFLEFEDVKELITAQGSSVVMCDVE